VIELRSCRARQKHDNETNRRPALQALEHIPNHIWEPDRNATLNIFLYIWGHQWTITLFMTSGLILRDRAQEAKTWSSRIMMRKFRGHELSRKIWAIERSASILRTTQFSKRIKMESQVHFDQMNFFHIKIKTFPEGNEKF